MAGTAPDTLKVINWNLEWFGKGSPHNAATQAQKVRQLMLAMNADVYALVEVVNVDTLESVVSGLGPDYGWYVSTFGSFAASPASPDYNGAQKLAIVYRKSKVNIGTRRAFLKTSSNAYYYFSSGRFPYLVETEIKGADSLWYPVTFVIVHAKAMSDAVSCNRRTYGAKEMKDSLDLYYPEANFLVLGDFNDDLDTSICSGSGSSNYTAFVNDPARYNPLTLPASELGVNSISGYGSFLDHVIASNEMAAYYVPGSATVLQSFVKDLVPSYTSQVSDHYPVQTQYLLRQETTGIGGIFAATGPAGFSLQAFPNPAHGALTITTAQACLYQLVAPNGQVLQSGQLIAGSNQVNVSRVAPGLYWLMAWNEKGKVIRQLVVQ